jgi:hypothetical protein
MISTQLWTTSKWALLNPINLLLEDSQRSLLLGDSKTKANLFQVIVCLSNKPKTKTSVFSSSNSNHSNKPNLILSETNSSNSSPNRPNSLNLVASNNRHSNHLSVAVSSKLSSQLLADLISSNSLLNLPTSATSNQLNKMPLKLSKMA